MQYLNAFLCGGILCAIGQIFIDKTQLTPARIHTIGFSHNTCLPRSKADLI